MLLKLLGCIQLCENSGTGLNISKQVRLARLIRPFLKLGRVSPLNAKVISGFYALHFCWGFNQLKCPHGLSAPGNSLEHMLPRMSTANTNHVQRCLTSVMFKNLVHSTH